MKEAKRRGGLTQRVLRAKPDRNAKPSRNVSYDVSEIPPELWAAIATFASRQCLARLCAASHEFYSKFSPLLYGNIFDPPLTQVKSSALVKTLSETRAPSGRPHLAEQVQQLKLTSCIADIKAVKNLLQNMRRLIPGAELRSGSVLRVLHWHLAAGLDELGKILGAPGHFPNLKELFVSTTGTNNNFNFIQIGGLEVLGVTFSLYTYDREYEDGDKLCYKLAEALQMLPSSSPLLNTLRLNLDIAYDENEFPYDGFADLIDEEEFGLVDPDTPPRPNFSAFLALHPTLLHLTLLGTGLPKNLAASFPYLRSFKGSFDESAIICSCRPPLETLVIGFVHRMGSDDVFPSLHVVPLTHNLHLTKLKIDAVDYTDETVKLTDELSPASFAQLVSSFPNLIDVDVCINKPMIQYRGVLVLLTKLRTLRLREYKTYHCTCHDDSCYEDGECYGPKKPIEKVFPPRGYITELSLLIPSLPHLASVEISILGDHIPPEPEADENRLFEPAEIEVDYHFSINRKSRDPKVILESTQISSDNRSCFC
ncbi:hypothetical protein B0H14DRAFT_2714102 [Mycena olivaceomarginata]|nr:hypothetical protein B0H14DRAFT_2714102 [Mycena olivaceomarginata]